MQTRPTKEDLSMGNAPLTYTQVFADEHEPVYSPNAFSSDADLAAHPGNEVVGPLAKLLGIDYRELHVLLSEIDPQVYIHNGSVIVPPSALRFICEHVFICEYVTPPVVAQVALIEYEALSER